MSQNRHVCTICCRLEVDSDAISDRNVETIMGYVVVSFEVANSNSFRDIPPKSFQMAEADINGSIWRKRIRVSLSDYWHCS